jgi:hypothetical protein
MLYFLAILLSAAASRRNTLTGITGRLKKTPFQEPYTNGRATFSREKYSRPGTYIIKSKKTGNIIYVGYSSNNLYRTLYRHFQQWNDRQQNRFVYGKNNYFVRVVPTTATRAESLEQALIRKYNPRDNKNKQTRIPITDAEIRAWDNYFTAPITPEEMPF